MSTKVVTASATEKVSIALRLMVKHKIGSIVVVEKESHPVGILTERDISIRIAKESLLQ
jgi:CBS domain-containing protein